MIKKYLIIFAIPLFAHAQGAISLDDAISYANEKNIDLKREGLDLEITKTQRLKAWSAQLPQVTVEGSHSFDNKFLVTTLPFNGEMLSVPAITPYSIVVARGNLLVFDGFATWDRISSASFAQKAKLLEFNRARFRLETDIRTKFFQAIGASALVEVAEQNIATLEQHWKNANAMVKAGTATKFDTLRVETLLEDAKAAKLAAEDNKVIARKRLWLAIGIPDDGRELRGFLPEDWDELPRDLTISPSTRQDREAALMRDESAHRLARAQSRFWVPSFRFFGEYNYYNNLNRSVLGANASYRTAYALGLSLSWNVFDGGKALAEQRQASLEAEKAALRVKEIDDSLPLDYELWRRRYAYSVANFEARRVAIKKAEESIRIARNGVKTGIRTNTEVLDAVRDLNLEKAKLVQSQIDAVEALGNLELAYGSPLPSVRIRQKHGAE